MKGVLACEIKRRLKRCRAVAQCARYEVGRCRGFDLDTIFKVLDTIYIMAALAHEFEKGLGALAGDGVPG